MGSRSLLRRLLSRLKPGTGAEPVPAAEPEEAPTPDSLAVDDPGRFAATELLFPAAFSIGPRAFRSRALALSAGPVSDPEEAGGAGAPWFAWKASLGGGGGPGAAIGVWWRVGAADPGGDPAAAEAWSRNARAVARAAGSALQTLFGGLPSLPLSGFSLSAAAPPALSGKAALRVDYLCFVEGRRFEVSAFASPSLPARVLAALGGVTKAGSDGSVHPLDALAAASTAYLDLRGTARLEERAFDFPVGGGTRRYLPLCELFNLLSEGDLRLALQNRILAAAPGPALGALFWRREKGPEGSAGIVPPPSLDLPRLEALLPAAALEDRRLSSANAAADAEAFLAATDSVYADLEEALGKGALVLSPAGTALVHAVHLRFIYAPRRARLDALVAAGSPLAELARLGERIARRAVDASTAEALAATVHGSGKDLAWVSRWCSRGKRELIAAEAARIEAALAEGRADIDRLVEARMAILAKAEAFLKEEARAAARGAGPQRQEGPESGRRGSTRRPSPSGR